MLIERTQESLRLSAHRHLWAWAFLLGFISQILFAWKLSHPNELAFDEFHYVPAARLILQNQPSGNWENPPLAKQFMALGIKLLGDRPIGWRVFSTIFGTITIMGMFWLGYGLFGSVAAALLVGGLTLFNQVIYVQSRIATLEIYFIAFSVWGFAAFIHSWNKDLELKSIRKLHFLAGFCFGLSAACKWSGWISWISVMIIFLFLKLLQNWRLLAQSHSAQHWYQPELFLKLKKRDWILAWFIIPLTAYFLTYLPDLIGGRIEITHLLRLQLEMWEMQTHPFKEHRYMSQWWSWPLMLKPVWYAFSRENTEPSTVRGIILLGNPLIFWGGLLTLLFVLRESFQKAIKDAVFISFFFLSHWLIWGILPRNVMFFYYYLPASLWLSPALSYPLVHLIKHKKKDSLGAKSFWFIVLLLLALVSFIYFFPVLSGLPLSMQKFRTLMWFSNWI